MGFQPTVHRKKPQMLSSGVRSVGSKVCLRLEASGSDGYAVPVEAEGSPSVLPGEIREGFPEEGGAKTSVLLIDCRWDTMQV